jgi:hypothetical protein
VLAVFAISSRFALRGYLCRRARRRYYFGIDDGFLLVGATFALAATAMLLHHVDLLFLSEAMSMDIFSADIPHDADAKLAYFHKVICVTAMMLWIAVCCAKFSMLFFFRKLIQRVSHRLTVWWWFVLAFNVVIAVYGCIAYFVPCPWFDLEISSNINPPLPFYHFYYSRCMKLFYRLVYHVF